MQPVKYSCPGCTREPKRWADLQPSSPLQCRQDRSARVIDEERLKAIEKRLSKASPFPWRTYKDNRYALVSHEGRTILAYDKMPHPECRAYFRNEGDMRFLAKAGEDLTDLVAEVRRLQAIEREMEDLIAAGLVVDGDPEE